MERAILLKNGDVVSAAKVSRADVLIEGERIAEVRKGIAPGKNVQVFDCSGKLVFPGAIDAHTHMGIPVKGTRSADRFHSGSRAALHGGVTTILDFTHLLPEESLSPSLQRRREEARDCLCDYGLHVNVTRATNDILQEIPELTQQGITSFKVFTTYREAGMMLGYRDIERVAEVVADAGGLLMVHAEDEEVLQTAKRSLDPNSPDPLLHARSRPVEAEAKAVRRLSQIAERTGCPVYIVHMSSRRGLHEAVQAGNLLLETCPQYLYLTEAAYREEMGRMVVASPPLRERADCRALRENLGTTISVLATDHCPFLTADKPPGQPYTDIPNGIGGVETLVPVPLARYLQRDLDVRVLAAVLAENPARIFGLHRHKGRVEEGYDADLAVYDPSSIRSDWFEDRESAADWDAYASMPALFPEYVWRRGELAVHDGHVVMGGPGHFLRAEKPS